MTHDSKRGGRERTRTAPDDVGQPGVLVGRLELDLVSAGRVGRTQQLHLAIASARSLWPLVLYHPCRLYCTRQQLALSGLLLCSLLGMLCSIGMFNLILTLGVAEDA
jgi:hypothetical protein